MRNIDNQKNLHMMRSLVSGNMPRTIVHTARQPVTEKLKKNIDSLAQGDEDDRISMTAKTFAEAEDDRAAASALALLYTEISAVEGDEYPGLLDSILEFYSKARYEYLVEFQKQTGDDRFEGFIVDRRFRQKAMRSGNQRMVLILRYLETMDSIIDGQIPDKDDGELDKKLDEVIRWYDLTCDKLLDRCKECLKAVGDDVLNDEISDSEHIKRIMGRAELEKKLLSDIIEKVRDHTFLYDTVTWRAALNKEGEL